MLLRWVFGALLQTEQDFRRIQGYRGLWILGGKGEGKWPWLASDGSL